MKKNWIILLAFGFMALGFSSCSNNTAEIEWRDKNLSFFDNLKGQEGIFEIGDSINGHPGIYYKILTEGNGAHPIIGNVVKVAYEGWLYNDSTSFDDNDNYEFTVGRNVIEGWSLAIQSMPVGSKWRIYLPYYLGYGSTAQKDVPAHSTLIFDIYLKKIVSEN